MGTVRKSRMTYAIITACVISLVLFVAGCAPQGQADKADNSSGVPTNDTSTKGEYVPFDPSVEAANTSGKAIEGSEEEELQQERIAGGSVGAVVSQNLEPLEGVVDSSVGEYVPNFGTNTSPPAVSHGDNGSDCLSCHNAEGTGAKQPLSHEKSNLANEDCGACHKASK